MWVLVMSGFAGTGLDSGGVEADPPGPIFLATTGRVVLIQWGVKLPQPPRQIEHWASRVLVVGGIDAPGTIILDNSRLAIDLSQ